MPHPDGTLTMAERADLDDEIFDDMATRGENPYSMVKRPGEEPRWDDPSVQEAARQARLRILAREARTKQTPFSDTDR